MLETMLSYLIQSLKPRTAIYPQKRDNAMKPAISNFEIRRRGSSRWDRADP